METLKNEIKDFVEKQKFFKNQRKTVNLIGKREVEPWVAAYTHKENRVKLRILYAVYGLMRGKKFSQIENHYPEENHPLNQFKNQIDKLILKYNEQTVRVGE